MTKFSYKIYVSFIIRGQELTPDNITEAIMVEPTKSFKIGDKKRKNIDVFYDKNCWYYSKESFSEADSVNDVIDRLIDDLKHAKNMLKCISREMDLVLSVAIYKNNDWPIIRLSNSTLVFLGEIGAIVDFDIYA